MPKTLKYVPTLIYLLPKPQAWSTKVGQPFSEDILFCLLKWDIADAWLFGLFGVFSSEKKMLCRQSYLTCPSFPIICGSEKQPMYGQVKQMILTGEYQRRTQLPGLQREANTKCFQPAFFPMAGKVWLFWLCWSLHNHKTVLGPFCLWPQYPSLCPLCKANNEQNFPFDQLWSF